MSERKMDLPWGVTSDFSYETGPIIECIADSAAGLERCRRIVDAVGARVRLIGDVMDGAAALAQGAAGDAVLVDLQDDAGAALDRLFEQLEAGALSHGLHSVVSLPATLIDPAAARITADAVTLLFAPSDVEIASALSLALRPGQVTARVREEGNEIELRRLSEEVSRIARTLAGLSSAEQTSRNPAPQPLPSETPAEPSAAAVRLMLRARRLRDRFFETDLFADPAWDMLLDLLLARLERRSVAVSSLCIAASVPPTTALRWIKRLTDEGLFVRNADPRDGRRVFIDLSNVAAHALASYFEGLRRLGLALP
jgi:hypothetical protein